MATTPPAPITEAELNQFVDNDSDFAFEMRVLNEFNRLKFFGQHSGTYKDPVTGKARQFDLRVRKLSDACVLTVAAECKNLQPNFPLLLSAVPRTNDESYHDVIRFREGQVHCFSNVERIGANLSRFTPHQMVGRKLDQVKRDDQRKVLLSDDSQTFDKCSQAINSSRDAIQDIATDSRLPGLRAVLPVLIVPDGTLFQVDYSSSGHKEKAPHHVPYSTLFVGHGWDVEGFDGPMKYTLSHIEIVTFGALEEIANEWMKRFFPK
jgi:hypothetical protein